MGNHKTHKRKEKKGDYKSGQMSGRLACLRCLVCLVDLVGLVWFGWFAMFGGKSCKPSAAFFGLQRCLVANVANLMHLIDLALYGNAQKNCQPHPTHWTREGLIVF